MLKRLKNDDNKVFILWMKCDLKYFYWILKEILLEILKIYYKLYYIFFVIIYI